ncbi:MAG: GNAT family N-acetyltransferase [Bacteroidales bacterium]|jgi:ribosomal protein S18 acetylase RimI-like enzyme|nr:GNAT family N-acetyltransferase [Bacteroidales bacterium]
MLIRQATRADLKAILTIENSSFEAERFTRSQLLYLMTKARGLFLVLELEEEIAGYLSVLTHKKHHSLRIYSIAVDPARRGMKLGQALIEKAIAYALELGLPALSLEVNTENSPAISLYARNGFEAVEILEDYYGKGENALKMIKKL